jgi:PAS domain S-box-containing protein
LGVCATAGAIAVAYFLAAELGLALLSTPSDVAVFWPASGLAAGILIKRGRGVRPALVIGVVVGTIAANLLSDRSFVTSALKGFCNAGEAVLMAWLLELWFGQAFSLSDLRRVVGFIAAAALAAAASAVGGAATMTSLHAAAPFLEAWRVWFLSDGVGILVVAPLVIGLDHGWRERLSKSELIESTAALGLLTLVSLYVVTCPTSSWVSFCLGALVLPLLLWLAARARSTFVYVGTFVVSAIVIGATTIGVGHFGDEAIPAADRAKGAQAAVLMVTVYTLVLSALLTERRSSEKTLHRLLDALPAAIQTTDTAGRITYCNQAAVDMWGTRPEFGKDSRHRLYRLYYPDGKPMPDHEQPCQISLTERRMVRDQEAILERSDGQRIPIIPCPSPLFDECGGFVGVVNMHVDISERKRAEEALIEREAQLAVFVEHAPAAIAMFDREMRYLAVSRRFVVDFRLPQDAQLIGRSHYEIFPDIPQRWRDVHARVLAGEALSQDEDRFARQDGRIDWVHWTMVPWRRANGNIGGALLFSEVRTKQVEARRALIDSEARFRATFENAAVGVVLVGPDGSIVRANNSYARMLGYSVEELKGRTFQDLTHPDDLATNLSALNKTLVGESDSYSIEKRYIRKDGGIVWVSVTVGSVRKADGGVDYFVAVVEDITDRKHAEARLTERNAQLDLAGKIARIGSFMYDDVTKKSQLSPGCAAIYGLPEGTLEISREDWRALVHPDDLSRLDAVVRRAFANGEREFVLEFRIFRHGQVRWIESRSLISYNEAGKPGRRIGAQVDVTDRKQAEQALAERNIQLALAAKAGLVGTFAYDANAEIMQISAGYAAIHGFPEGTTDIARSECLADVHPDDIERVEQLRSEAFCERRREYNIEYRIIRPGGELRWVEARCFISFIGGGHPHRVVGVSIDITERKRAEEHLQAMNAELDHRVKNILATASAVAAQTLNASRSSEHFVSAFDGRLRSMAQTHELLSERLWRGVPLAELLRRELAPYAGGNNTEIGGPEVVLTAEAGQTLAMVFHELATNAAKHGAFSSREGKISVEWRRQLNGDGGAGLVIEWQETGGPPVKAECKAGYGISVIRELIPHELAGKVDHVLTPEGARCQLELPGRWVDASSPIERTFIQRLEEAVG